MSKELFDLIPEADKKFPELFLHRCTKCGNYQIMCGCDDPALASEYCGPDLSLEFNFHYLCHVCHTMWPGGVRLWATKQDLGLMYCASITDDPAKFLRTGTSYKGWYHVLFDLAVSMLQFKGMANPLMSVPYTVE